MKTPRTPLAEFESIDQLVPILVELGCDLEMEERVSGSNYLFIHQGEREGGYFVRFCKKGRLQPDSWCGYDTVAGVDWQLEIESLTPLDFDPELFDYEPDPDFISDSLR